MTFPKPVLSLLVVAPLLALVASCVDSQHPLSNEKTSKTDERLIGVWQMKDDSTEYRVEKSTRRKNALEVTIADPNATGPCVAFTTTVDSKAYLSIANHDEEAVKRGKESTYNIYRYRFIDNDSVELRGMDSEAIMKAIADKKLGGKIKVTRIKTGRVFWLFGKETWVEEKEPIITDSPEGIARYLHAHAGECYPANSELAATFERHKSAQTSPPKLTVPAISAAQEKQLSGDKIPTDNGALVIHPINHATFVMQWNGKAVYVDPVGGAKPFADLPKPDLVLVTHMHFDHFDPKTLEAILPAKGKTVIVAPKTVAEKIPEALRGMVRILANGEKTLVGAMGIEAVPAYNSTPGKEKFHPKGRDNGYVL